MRKALKGLAFGGPCPERGPSFQVKLALSLGGILAANLASEVPVLASVAAAGAGLGFLWGRGRFFKWAWVPALLFGLLVPLPSLFLTGPEIFFRLSLRVLGSLAWAGALASSTRSERLARLNGLLFATWGQIRAGARRLYALLLGFEARAGMGWLSEARFVASRGALLLAEAVRLGREAERASEARGEGVLSLGVEFEPAAPFEVREVEFSWDGTRVFEGLSLTIEPGLTVIRGSNGSGKSTLIYLLAGLEFPLKGEILFFGKPLTPRLARSAEFRRKVGILFQEPEAAFLEPVVLDDIALGPKLLGLPEPEKRALWAAQRLGITDLLERSPFTLSRGQRKRVALAGLLAIDPEVWLLDEPFEGLDPEGIFLFKGLIDEAVAAGKAVVITEPPRASVEFEGFKEYVL